MQTLNLTGVYRYSAKLLIIQAPPWILLNLCLGLVAIDHFGWTAIAVSSLVGIILSMVVGISHRLVDRNVRAAISRAAFTSAIIIVVGCLWYLIFALIVRHWAGSPTTSALGIISVVGAWCVLFAPFGLRVIGVRNRRARQRADEAFLASQKVFSPSANLSILHLLNALDHIRKMVQNRKDKACEYLELLAFLVSIYSDPRFQNKAPLRVAVSVLDRFAELKEMQQCGSVTYSSDWSPASMDLLVRPTLLYTLASASLSYSIGTSGHALLHFSSEITHGALQIRLATNIDFKERAFQRGKGIESIQLELDRVATELSKSVKEGVKVDRLMSDNGGLIWQLIIPQEDIEPRGWEAIEQELGPGLKLLSDCRYSLGKNRVYFKGKQTLKISRDGVPNQKPLSLEGECSLLQSFRGRHGLPQLTGYGRGAGYEWMSYEHIDGVPLNEWISEQGNAVHWPRILADLSHIVQQLNAGGIAYRDWFQPDNILISKDGDLHLLDFDQAIMTLTGSEVDFLGLGDCVLRDRVLQEASLESLSSRLGLQGEDEKTYSLLNEGWEIAAHSRANSPEGPPIAYYALQFREWALAGERPWYERWIPIKAAVNEVLGGIANKTVLELGCNMGLASTYLSDLGANVTGVDLDEDVLKAANLVARAFNTSPKFVQADLCDGSTFGKLEDTYDLVCALSVVHWLPNKEPILEYLSRQSVVLYEGHGIESEDLQLLEACGFQKHRILGYTNRLRPIILSERMV